MASLQSMLVASGLLLVMFVNAGSAIKCFECNSNNDTECNDLTIDPTSNKNIDRSRLLVDCGTHSHGVQYKFCRKITQVIEFSVNNLQPNTRVIRSCGWDESSYKGSCYQRSGFGGRQVVCACYEDECNGASPTMQVTLFGLVLSAFLAYILRV